MTKNINNNLSNNKEKKKNKINIKNNIIIKEINKKFKELKDKLRIEENRFNFLELFLLMVIAFVFGIFISEAIVLDDVKGNSLIINDNKDNSSISEIDKVYNDIIKNYYQEIDKEKLNEAAIKGMMDYLADDYSIYFDEEQATSFNEKLNGSYLGIGIEIGKASNGDTVVTTVFENSPASKVGIKEQDILLKINDEDITSLTNKEIVSKIKGSLNKQVKITLKRNGETINTIVATEEIELSSVYYEVIEQDNKKIGYIYISIFALNTGEQFKAVLKELNKENIKDLIIDVRNNTGGHLSTVANILDVFLNKNQVLYQTKVKEEITKVYGTTNGDSSYNIVVLANENSASASEILASAIKEEYNGIVVGKTTFGKGTVQKLLNLSTGGMLKITTETWLTSNGNAINKVGVIPNYEVDLAKEYYNNPTNENDNQLQKAIEILKTNGFNN